MHEATFSTRGCLTDEKRESAQLFDRAAATYDRVGPRIFTHFGEVLAEVAELSRGERVLDVAAGRGAALFPAAARVGTTGRVVGIDLSEAMVRELREEIDARGAANASALVMDAEQLAFEDESFDVVLCGFGIFFFPDPRRAVDEFRRVLRPSGRVALTTWRARDNERWPWYAELLRRYVPGRASAAAPDFPQLLRDAGYVDLVVVEREHEFVYADEEEWWRVLWSHAGRGPLEEVARTGGQSVLEQLKQEAFAELESLRRPDGIHDVIGAFVVVARTLFR